MEAFAAADRADALAAEDLELMGEAAWWAAKSDEAADALERAFARYVEAGRSIEAAGVALHLAYQAFRRLAPSVGGGWVARAEQLLEGVPASPMHAWLHLFYAIAALLGNNAVEGLALADRAIAVAREPVSSATGVPAATALVFGIFDGSTLSSTNKSPTRGTSK